MTDDRIGYQFDTEHLQIRINGLGEIVGLTDPNDNTDYLASDRAAPLLQIAVDGTLLSPTGGAYDSKHKQITLHFTQGMMATVTVGEQPSHLAFELTAFEGRQPTHVVWGPFPTTINGIIGETVGVVRNDRFAFGLQALNIHTIGGFPIEFPSTGPENDAATRIGGGSELRAYSRETDGGINHSRIALFGCPMADALQTLGQIEIEENLPHPMLDGAWCKTARTSRTSYLITAFGENTVDEAIRYTRMAGFTYFYHEDPFGTWGHFGLKTTDFPHGDAGLKSCVDEADKAGLRIGIHTLSNFMTTNDAYVTPVPDPRLMQSDDSLLTNAVDAKTTEIPIASRAPFLDRGTLSAVLIENELIRYRAVSEEAPWLLLGCRRGAFNTSSSSHASGTKIGKLVDHPYRVLFPDLSMQDEMADRLVELFNGTGLRQISFDGLEGCALTGHGMYAYNRFVNRIYNAWTPEVLNDASRLTHYLWHIHTRMNWGEPWGKAIREGQIELRLKNQDYFKRNLFPRMFGWFQLRLASGSLEATSLDDMEWVLSKCAGYDSGFALSSSLEALRKNGQSEVILGAVREWEQARLEHAFTPDQIERLQEPTLDFHLEADGKNRWQLYPVTYSQVHIYSEVTLQPGEPGEAEWTFHNPYENQPLQFILRALPDTVTLNDDVVINPVFEVNFTEITLPIRLSPFEYLVCEGDGVCKIFDVNWNPVRSFEFSGEWPQIVHEDNQILFWFGAPSSCRVEVRFKTNGPGESVITPNV